MSAILNRFEEMQRQIDDLAKRLAVLERPPEKPVADGPRIKRDPR